MEDKRKPEEGEAWDEEEEEENGGFAFGGDLGGDDDDDDEEEVKEVKCERPAPLNFFEYPKMDVKSGKNTKAAQKQKGQEEEEWVVLEKVHGCNFSFICNGVGVASARRTSLLADGETFYGWQKARDKYREGVLAIFAEIQQFVEGEDDLLVESFKRASKIRQPKGKTAPTPGTKRELATITVFGELFGGIYPHPEVTDLGLLHCQKGVYYTPDIEFYAYDIYLRFYGEENGIWLNYQLGQRLFAKYNFFFARPLARGPLVECLRFDIQINSTIPALLGLPALPKNQMEGVVIKSVEPIYTTLGKRQIFKHKNAKFEEVNPKVPMTLYEKKRAEEASAMEKVYNEAERYLNDNRMNNLRSKIGEVDGTDRAKVTEACVMLCDDVIVDFTAAEPELWKLLDSQQQETAKRNIRSMVNGWVSAWIAKNHPKPE